MQLKEEESHSWEEDEEQDEDTEELALWSPDVQVLELQKEQDKGLGFSILDYQVTAALPSSLMTAPQTTTRFTRKHESRSKDSSTKY